MEGIKVPGNMQIDIHIHHVDVNEIKKILDTILIIKQNTISIMATQEEAAAKLGAVATQLAKANTEIQAKIQALVDAANAADTVNPALQAAIDALVPAAQTLDDIVPDAPTP
jgi:hypothetical protein